MKKYSARYLSNKEKEFIVERIGKGEKVSRISREINVSRTTLYKWLKLKSTGVRDFSSRIHRRRASLVKRRKIVKLVLEYPNYSIRQISSLSGFSVGFVWSVMKERSLSTRRQRQARFLAKGTVLYRNIKGTDKVAMIDRYRAGESVTKICLEYGISRTIFYRWIHKCNKEGNKYVLLRRRLPKGGSHWRFNAGIEGIVRDLVASDPELSLSKLHNRIRLKHADIISRSGLYYVCKRLELTTYENRLIYARSGSFIGVAGLGLPLLLLSMSSLAISFWVLVFGQSITQYEPSIRPEEVNRISPDRQVYEAEQGVTEIIYIVRAGDSLWKISEEIYGSGYNWVDIASINKLPNPDLIDIGQRLIIPVVRAKEVVKVAAVE